MKAKIYIILFLVTPLWMSCESFLRIQPEDKYIEEQVYGSEKGIQMALNGIYLNMTGNNTYGASLTSTYIELLGQRWVADKTSISPYKQFGTYNYQDQEYVQPTLSAIWQTVYKIILDVNVFIRNVETTDKLTEDNRNLLLGEAYGLRAFMHFDILRIFGPIYSMDSLSMGTPAGKIPYSTETTAAIQDLLPANEVMSKIVQDLAKAEQLLQKDPVKVNGTGSQSDVNINFYSSFRNRRMNYYAVKALQARVFLYRGDKVSAAQAVNAILPAVETFFPWVTLDAVNNTKDPDRVFSTEVLFGIQNPNMYNIQKSYFDATLSDSYILVPIQTNATSANNLEKLFENYTSDFRLKQWIASGGRAEETFFKYADIENKSLLFRMFQPLIRKSELYYILAECTTDETAAKNAMEEVRKHRGLGDTPQTGNLTTELKKEYIKEFFGEGQLFFYYKRNNITSIPNGSAATGNKTMGATQYVVPLPESETNVR